MLNLISGILLLYGICILQRIDFLGTSLGFYSLILVFFVFIVKCCLSKKIKVDKKIYIYILSLFPFFISLIYSDYDKVFNFISAITPPLMVAIIVFSYDDFLFSLKSKVGVFSLVLLSIIYFLIMCHEADAIFDSQGVIKKIYKFGNPNYLAFCILFIQSMWLFLYENYKVNKIISIVFWVSSFLSLLLTFSKSAYVVEFVFILYVIYKSVSKKTFVTIFSSSIFFLMIGFGYIINQSDFFDAAYIFLSGDVSHGTSSRTIHFIRSWNIFSENIFFGIGRDNYLNYSGGYKTHNIIMTILAESGILGILLYLIFILNLSFYMFKKSPYFNVKMLVLLNYIVFILTHADGEILTMAPVIIYILCYKEKRNKFNYE